MAERLAASSNVSPKFGRCCQDGKVTLPLLPPPPRVLRGLFTASDPAAREFRTNIIRYNLAFAFTSLGVEIDRSVNQRFGPDQWVFKIHGQLRHLSGALEPDEGTPPSYSQLYLYEPTEALDLRMQRNNEQRVDTMSMLQRLLLATNPYAQMFEHAYNVLKCYDVTTDIAVRLRVMPGSDTWRYNLPAAPEVAMILPGDNHQPANHQIVNRDIILHRRSQSGQPRLRRINELHPSYEPLQYPLLFPHGEAGWHPDLKSTNPRNRTWLRITQMEHAAFRLHRR